MQSTLQLIAKLRRHAFEPALVKRALVMMLVVGTTLVMINHGSRVCEGNWCIVSTSKALLTMAVPYFVSTVSSVMAIEDQQATA